MLLCEHVYMIYFGEICIEHMLSKIGTGNEQNRGISEEMQERKLGDFSSRLGSGLICARFYIYILV